MVGFLLIVIGFVLLLCLALMFITTPIHEACHVGLSIIDPCLEIKEINLIAPHIISGEQGDHTLPSMLGYVVVREAYPGAFKDRPAWADLLQEIICLSVQLLITIIVTLKATVLLVKKLRTYVVATPSYTD